MQFNETVHYISLILEARYRLYLNREAGVMVAIAADDRLAGMVTILTENPLAGVKAGRSEKQRKLVVPHFPFIIVYVAESARVRILRVL